MATTGTEIKLAFLDRSIYSNLFVVYLPFHYKCGVKYVLGDFMNIVTGF